MVVLRSIDIRNFQGHAKTRFEFVPGMNVLVGQTAAGKTTVFEAIRWVTDNRPLGFDFKRRQSGEKEAVEVCMTLDDGTRITRFRSKTANYYRIERNGTSETFDPGSGLPHQVLELLNIGEINWQGQFDSHFLLSLPPPQAARVINTYLHLDIIDNAVSRANTLRRRRSSRQQDLAVQVQKVKNILGGYERLEDLDERIAQQEEDVRLRTELGDHIAKISENVLRHDFLRKRREVLSKAGQLKVLADEFSGKITELQSQADRVVATRTLIGRYDGLRRQGESLERLIQHQAFARSLGDDIANCISLGEKERDLAKLIQRHDKNLSMLDLFEKKMSSQGRELSSAQAALAEVSKEQLRCPLCGAPVEEGKVQHVFETWTEIGDRS